MDRPFVSAGRNMLSHKSSISYNKDNYPYGGGPAHHSPSNPSFRSYSYYIYIYRSASPIGGGPYDYSPISSIATPNHLSGK